MKCQEQKRDQFFKSIGNIFITPDMTGKIGREPGIVSHIKEDKDIYEKNRQQI